MTPASGQSAQSRGSSVKRLPRLIIVGPLPPPFIGPAVATEHLLASALLNEHFEVHHVDTSDPDGFDRIGDFHFSNVVMALRHGWRFMQSVVARRPSVVYIPIARGLWGFIRDLLFILPARLSGAAVVVHLRAGRFDLIHDHGPMGRALARVGLGSATRAVVLGESVRDVFRDFVSDELVRVVPNGLRADEWNASAWIEERSAIRGLRIACVTNLFHAKGIHVVLEAVRILRDRGVDVNATFGGDWSSDAYREQCLKLVETHSIGHCVTFLGRIDGERKRELLRNSNVSVFVPVMPEGLPWVVLEAMAAGLPVVGTPQGTMKELIADGHTGFLVGPGDAAGTADRLAELADSLELRSDMGHAARARLEERYTERRAQEALLAVFDECISQHD